MVSFDLKKQFPWKSLSRTAYITTLAVLIFFGTMGVIHAQADSSLSWHRYVGDETCEVCHSSRKIGDQFDRWKDSPHAKAYTDLGGVKARIIGQKLGIIDPQKSARCLSCHTTAATATLPEITSVFRKSDGVQCESCHGPGEDYSRFSVMINPDKSRREGLIAVPDKQTCLVCHNPSSPTYQPFHYQKAVRRIAHPLPAGANEK